MCTNGRNRSILIKYEFYLYGCFVMESKISSIVCNSQLGIPIFSNSVKNPIINNNPITLNNPNINATYKSVKIGQNTNAELSSAGSCFFSNALDWYRIAFSFKDQDVNDESLKNRADYELQSRLRHFMHFLY